MNISSSSSSGYSSGGCGGGGGGDRSKSRLRGVKVGKKESRYDDIIASRSSVMDGVEGNQKHSLVKKPVYSSEASLKSNSSSASASTLASASDNAKTTRNDLNKR